LLACQVAYHEKIESFVRTYSIVMLD